MILFVNYRYDTDLEMGDANSVAHHDRSERSIQKLIKLRNSVMRSYQMYSIPTAWMLDSGMMSKVSFFLCFCPEMTTMTKHGKLCCF